MVQQPFLTRITKPIVSNAFMNGLGRRWGGGANTNRNGKQFENITSNEPYLMSSGYIHTEGLWMKDDEDAIRFYGKNTDLDEYLQNMFGVQLIRRPDEIYMTVWKPPQENHTLSTPSESNQTMCKGVKKHRVKILEKKAQYTEGSVETKLWAADGLLHEYREVFGERFEVEYAFCVNHYLKQCFTDPSAKKKYRLLQDYLEKKNVPLFFGEDPDYFQQLHDWLRRDA